MECLTMVSPKDIEIGKTKIGLSYPWLIGTLIVAVGGLTTMFNLGGDFREVSLRMTNLEATSDRRFNELEKQIEEVRKQMKELQKDKEEEKLHRQNLENMLRQLLDQQKGK